MLEDLAGDRGNAAEAGELLVAGELQGLVDVPLVHHDDLAAAHGAADHRRHAADVEHGRGRQRGRLPRWSRHVCGEDRLPRRGEGHVPEVRDHRPVGDERALGSTGGPRRVHEHNRVVAPEPCDVSSAMGGPATRSSSATSPCVVRTPISCRPPSSRRRGRAPSSTGRRASSSAKSTCTPVAERVVELFGRPPRVQRHDDRAVQCRCPST